MTGQISPEEASILNKWRLEAEANDRFLQEIELLWSSSLDYEPKPSLDAFKAKQAFFEAISDTPKETTVYSLSNEKTGRQRSIYSWVSVAAAIFVLVGAFFIYRNNYYNPVPDFMQTGEPLVSIDKKQLDKLVELPDGSVLWLKPGSHFRYEKDFNKTDRTVYLHGEMFIHVARNPEKPFLIRMEQNSVRVLGTSFYIKSNEEDWVEVQVEEGLVEFTDQKKQIRQISAGNSAVYMKSSASFVQDDSEQEPLKTEWRKNYLVFEDVSLVNVFNRLKIFYGVDFKLDCPAIEELAGFTSLVQRNEKPELKVFLQAIEKVYGIQIEPLDEKSYLVTGEPCY